MSAGPEGFSLSFSSYKGTVSLAVTGTIDGSAAEELRSLLRDVIDDPGNLSLTIDLTGVASIDSVGLSVLVEAAEQMRDKGGRLLLTRPRPATRKLLDLTGLDHALAEAP